MRCSWNGYYLEYCGFVKQVTSHFRRHLKKYDRMWFLLRIYLSSVGRGIYGNPWEKSRVEVCVTVDSISFNPRKSIRTKDSLNKRDNKKIRINKVVKRPQPTLFYGTRIEFSKNKKKKKSFPKEILQDGGSTEPRKSNGGRISQGFPFSQVISTNEAKRLVILRQKIEQVADQS